MSSTEAIFLLLERAKLLVEPSGAASLAVVLYERINALQGRKVAVVLTGGNVNFPLLMEIISKRL